MNDSNNKYIGNKAFDELLQWVKIVVGRYVSKKIIPHREQEDVEMAIVEKFLRQKAKIDLSFKGNSKLSTFYIAVINKMCCEMIRKESRHWYSVNEEMNESSTNYCIDSALNSDKKLAISYEIKRLSNVLLFFNGDRAKINVCLKIYFDIDLSEKELRDYEPIKESDIHKVLTRPSDMSKAEKYELMANIINNAEGKNTKGDAVRMWLEQKIQIILTRLNSKHESSHDKESLGILLEYKENFSTIKQNMTSLVMLLLSIILVS
jgi:hypothetical protein